MGSRYKQVIVVRRDLRMSAGKLAAQAAHAAAELACGDRGQWYRGWREDGQPKVVLQVADEAELLAVQATAIDAALPAVLIHDRGLTQLEPGTVTCLGIGPAPSERIDAVTGELRLL